MRCLRAGAIARAAASISPTEARARLQIVETANRFGDGVYRFFVAGRRGRETRLDDVTRRSRNAAATRSFSATPMLKPGACSPSRSVVSKITTRLSALLSSTPRHGTHLLYPGGVEAAHAVEPVDLAIEHIDMPARVARADVDGHRAVVARAFHDHMPSI